MATPVDNPAYPEVPSSPDLPTLESDTLASWKANGTFQQSIDNRDGGANEFVFYDGPPFANGLPHYGHLLTGYVKDIVPRYQAMKGRRVERRFGWDCHGLPAELEAEKELGIRGRQAIIDLGIDKFNQTCEKSVMKYTSEWESYVTRQARWVDFQNDYKTMDKSYMESVLWAFKQLFDKGLIYEGHMVMPYSWAMETTVSNFETRMDNAYRERQDPAATVAFGLLPKEGEPDRVDVLAWTTTPWTLPSNLALAVGEALDYAVFEKDGGWLVIASALAAKFEKELDGAEQIAIWKGSEMVGRKYTPLFPYFQDHEGAFRVISADFVSTDDGTGVVHLAPGFGEDDQRVCKDAGIELVCPVDSAGKFTFEVTDYDGMQVFEANRPILRRLREEGRLFREESYVHNYPHCWRTDTPLIYKAVSSWFVKVTAFRDRMVELNQDVRWIPGHVKDGQFGKWLEGARDWSISRSRFWGSPLPIWRSDDPRYPRLDVYGSIAELEEAFGVEVPDLHRPFIDTLTRPNPDDPSGNSTMRRVDDVLDCWFESGSMPFAQVHYPFENKDWFESHFPADFVVEYVAQTRGWFYTAMVMATALFDKPPFKNVICHGVVVDENNQKLSKRLKNYPDPTEMFDTHGSDAMRWYLCSSPILRGQDLSVDIKGKGIAEIVRLVIMPIWNAWSFFSMYARADGISAEYKPAPASNAPVLDRYILAKTRELVSGVTTAMDNYELSTACAEVRVFLDAFNNWYIRRSRGRFWSPVTGDAAADAEKFSAYDTMYTVLHILTRTVAPLLPLVSEEIFLGLVGRKDGASVHLTDWPDAKELPDDSTLVREMDLVRDVCTGALAVRNEEGLRVRLPLQSLTIAGPGASQLADIEGLFELVKDEVNIKSISVDDNVESLGRYELFVNARAAGPRLGKNTKEVIVASKKGAWTDLGNGKIEVAGYTLEGEEFELRLVPREGLEGKVTLAIPSSGVVIALNVVTTDELEAEGIARDVVRLIQEARKTAGLEVSDHIDLNLGLPEAAVGAVQTHRDYVSKQTLADSISFDAPVSEGSFSHEATLLGQSISVHVTRIERVRT